MLWWKRLSQSDARQETEGGLMPFRFTRENCPGNFVTWFREEFFKELNWRETIRSDYQIEEADVVISVNIGGEDLGQRVMRLTHAERRHKNNRAPATHLDFDAVTKEYLHNNDMTSKHIIFSKELNGGFKLVIQENAPY
jgi:hypothetical protein